MLGKATQLKPNITVFLRDFKRARYQKLAFVEIVTNNKQLNSRTSKGYKSINTMLTYYVSMILEHL